MVLVLVVIVFIVAVVVVVAPPFLVFTVVEPLSNSGGHYELPPRYILGPFHFGRFDASTCSLVLCRWGLGLGGLKGVGASLRWFGVDRTN